ncbi:MAG: MTH938/NDUFAF3 family protein [archaeon]
MKPVINGSSFGTIIIDEKVYTNHVIVYSDGEIKKANIRHESLTVDFVKPFLKPGIELVIIATGTSGCLHLYEGLKDFLKEKNIELFTGLTPAACEKFNKTKKKTVAFLHLTC